MAENKIMEILSSVIEGKKEKTFTSIAILAYVNIRISLILKWLNCHVRIR